LHMANQKKQVLPHERVRKSLTEIQERVVDRMLSGESFLEATDNEGVSIEERYKWDRLGTAFEEIKREKLAGSWGSCSMMTLRLIRESQKRLLSIITKGKDSDATKASGVVLKMMKLIVPNGYRFTLTQQQEIERCSAARSLGDYWEGVGDVSILTWPERLTKADRVPGPRSTWSPEER